VPNEGNGRHARPGVRSAWAEIVAHDPAPWLGYLRALGFSEEPGAPAGDPTAYLQLGAARVRVTAEPRPGSPAGQWLADHGEGVFDVALAVPDLARALAELRAAGGQAGGPERREVPGYGQADTAVAYVPGAGIRHTLVEGYQPPPGGPHALDHVALAVSAGGADEVAAGYASAFGLAWTPAENVIVGPEGLVSGVLDGEGLTIVLVAQDPARQSGQVDQFLYAHAGPGAQHLAFRTPDIRAAVRQAAAAGARFLDVPDAYYDALPARVPAAIQHLHDLRELHILADTDGYGDLLQVFTACPAPPSQAFFELIQRDGARGFGTDNIAHLYAARQAEAAAAPGTAG
jgi:4-hydroxymandelate synthase